ncbi:hypothetical protein EJB05_30940, partial [Eragrostis curvula]
MKLACLQLLLVAFQATLITMSSAGLQYNFYSSSCPSAEDIVRNKVNGMIDADKSTAAALIRVLFHDCFVNQLIASFAAKNLSADDLVSLSGAHSIGTARCSGFTNRLYPTVDPSLDAAYATQLKAACPSGGPDNAVNNSPVSPDALSNQYYRNALGGRVLFTSDAALMTRNDTAAAVSDAADATGWMARFAASLVKMAAVEVLTGAQGEIRRLCNATNS